MNKMFDAVKQTQSTYPALFSGMEKAPWGMLFYNPNNTLSVEANHGVLFAPCNYEKALEDVRAYYKNKGVPPRLYCYLAEEEFPRLQQAAEELGYTLTPSDLELLVCQNPTQKAVKSPLTFEILQEWDKGINEHIIGENLHLEGLLRGSMKHNTYRLIAGRLFGTPVTMAGLWDNGDVMRISNVMTGEQFRGLGFGGALITHVLSLAAATPKPVYLFANNPTAIRMYQRVGMEMVTPDFRLFTLEGKEK